MNIPILLLSFGSIITLLYATYDLWFKPNRYLEDVQRRRLEWYNTKWIIWPMKHFLEYFDQHPNVEIWYSRIIVAILILMYLLGILLAITGSL